MSKATADFWLILGILSLLLGTLIALFCIRYDKPITAPIANLYVIGLMMLLGSDILRKLEKND